MTDPVRRWNHNIHYHRRVLDAVPQGARTALDVGTGDGLLAAELSNVIPAVTAIDLDHTVLERARTEEPRVKWVHGDVMTFPFAETTFDVVASIATVHHLPDTNQALQRLAELTSPGGVLIVVGVAKSSRPTDLLHSILGLAQHHFYSRRYGVWEHTAPTVWPPRHTYTQVRSTAKTILPGMIWTQLPLWRYALTWTKPHP
ncbi:class I SAM-dependent methyltransferase [Rhodococcus sp. BP-252]|uniref:class I SAM-dependent methyltransferase n=1 Tax=unclassified Rhodococcus (in: high G+C Gram-positive bacteria) TaxID=192944 RepID=UPI001C9B66BE|nr:MULTISPECIES: class I SAM-dependent methyltransferase [unclassified Rhodococcus (in: high G+C Gram-positive bacteria)]MBY6413344.1 class I SAM-dependent methyltransferase [Rhodococcus sp. BP-320]MBY6418052.1 class I SAM-dependent methyltransferase [Rhodococcus sp. BP-321]MBY6422258.1 class I SAM-dependent methyltransferase [Rhodococcus sp. BP-324]MBY6428101.1 class I SAM-dependent methyltransferase [Rhodococcus sp. BP-323]MBY6433265.1 class I SAM-dependent methyltransferase [Rhodococcus sp.